MKFLTRLFGGKTKDTSLKSTTASGNPNAPVKVDPSLAQPVMANPDSAPHSDLETLKSVVDHVATKDGAQAGLEEAVNIWDVDEADVPEVAAEAPVKSRRRRNATRLLGFDTNDDGVVDLFDQNATKPDQTTMQYPTGWLLVVEGEGRGHCFGLMTGLNQVGRGPDNSIQLDFGDTAISRKNHFAVAYDEEDRKFILGHGGKTNVIRLNGNAVISNEDLSDGDKIKVGATVLQLKTLCGPDFNWAETDTSEGQDDVAIA